MSKPIHSKFLLILFLWITSQILSGCFTDAPSKNVLVVKGSLVDSDNNPIEGATVLLLEIPTDSLDMISWSESENLTLDTLKLETGSDGSYEFSDITAGHYTVFATKATDTDTLSYSSGRLTIKNKTVDNGQNLLEKSGGIEIEILKSGRPLINILCVVPDLHLSDLTDSEGKCHLETPAGTYEVLYVSEIYDVPSQTVTVKVEEVTQSKSITAKYAVEFLSLVLETEDSGSAVVPDTAVSVGAEKKTSIKAVPANGVTFVHWEIVEGDVVFDNIADPETNILILENARIKAVFRRNAQLKMTLEGEGSTDPKDSVILASGNSRTILATPDKGWEFSKWSAVEGVAVFGDETKNETQVTIYEDAVIKAVFIKPSVLVTLETSEGGTLLKDSLTIEVGQAQSISASANEGYVFVNWEVLEGDLSLGDDSSTTTELTPKTNGKVKANFTKSSGSLVIERQGNGLTDPSEKVSIKHGVSISITAAPDTGWAFSYWTVLSGNVEIEDSTKADTRVTANTDGKIKAVFTKESVVLNTEVSGKGSVSPSEDTTVASLQDVTLKATPEEHWKFKKWEVKQGSAHLENDTLAETKINLASNATVQAHFLPVQFQLSIQAVGEGTATPANDTLINSGSSVNINAVPSEGWEFDRWQVVEGEASIEDSKKAETKITLKSETSLRAVFRLQNYLLRVTTEGNGSTDLSDSQHIQGASSINIKATANPGWNFDSWSVVSGTAEFENASNASTVLKVFSDAEIKAKFMPTYALLTLGVSGSGNTTPKDTATIQLGTPFAIEADAAGGWSFVNWTAVSGNANFENRFASNTNVVMLEASEIRANFSNNITTLKVTKTGQGKTTPADSANVAIGVATDISADPDPGWKFGHWSVTNGNADIQDSTKTNTKITVNSASTIEAVFIDNRTTLTMTKEGSGTIDPASSAQVEKGIPTDISATPAAGWGFVNWEIVSGGASLDEESNPNTSVTLSSASTLKAIFSENDVTLNIEAGTGGSVSPSEAQVVKPGTKVDVEATPVQGAQFSHWTVISGSVNLEDSTASITKATVNGNGTIKALFKYELIVAVTGTGTTDPAGVKTYNPGEVVDISATPGAGWSFEEWKITAGTAAVDKPNEAQAKLTMNSSSTLEAVFKQKPVLLTMTQTGSGDISPSSDTLVSVGQKVAISAAPATSWAFSHWEVVSGNVTIEDQYSSNTNIYVYDSSTVKAVFGDVDTLTIGVAQGLGSTNPAGTFNSIPTGNTYPIKAIPSEGWVFKRWVTAMGNASIEDSTKDSTSVTVNGNDSVGAVFAKLVTLRVGSGFGGSPGDGGSVTPDTTVTLETGSVHPITATPNAFHKFKEWSLIKGNSSIADKNNANTTVTVTDSTEISAVFERFAILTTTHNTGGTASPAVDTSKLGQEIAITATPSFKYVFWRWRVISGQAIIKDVKDPTTTVTLGSDSVQVQALFVRPSDILTLTMTSTNGGTTIPASTAQVLKGQPFSIQAVPNALFRFTTWSVTSGTASVAVPTNPKTTVTLTTNATVNAAFTRGLIIGEKN